MALGQAQVLGPQVLEGAEGVCLGPELVKPVFRDSSLHLRLDNLFGRSAVQPVKWVWETILEAELADPPEPGSCVGRC